MKKRWLGLLILTGAIAQTGFAMAQRPDPSAPPPPVWVQIMPFAVMLVVFYMLLIRPQMKQRKDKDALINNLKKGDHVITSGGLIVTVVNVGATTLDVKLNDETKARILKSSVLEVTKEEALS